jgi:hypothetical protein
MLLGSVVILLLSVSLSPPLHAQEKKAATPATPETKVPSVDVPKQPPANPTTVVGSATAPTQQTGVDRPATLLPADTEEVTVKVQLRNLDGENPKTVTLRLAC